MVHLVVNTSIRRAGGGVSRLLTAIGRKKILEDDASPLARVLSLLDLTALGVGATLGLGVYVLAGEQAKTNAGPAVVLSFAVAGVASFFAGLCYAELAARVPKAGSAYVYAYVAVGELIAFTIGWTLILEYAIGAASMTRGVSNYVDNLTGHTMANYLKSILPIGIPHLAEYPDFFAFGIIAVLSIMLAVGVKESSLMNNILTLLNVITVIIAVIAGATKADPHLWSIDKSEIPANYTSIAGEGGFFPFGMKGVIAGAATCFFGYIGFDCIATTSEEAKNPRKNIPLSIILSLFIVFLAYFSISTVLTMMRPYYLQDEYAPFPTAFGYYGMDVIKWIVTIGAIFALSTGLLGSMFPLPRVVYSMARDGLLFDFLGRVNERTQTPLVATIISGLLSGIVALVFDLTQLIAMSSIGTLVAYSIVALCVMILRYSEGSEDSSVEGEGGLCAIFGLLVNSRERERPTRSTAFVSSFLIGVFIIITVTMCAIMRAIGGDLYNGSGNGAVPLAVMGASLIVILVLLSRQPKSDAENLSFSVPLIPWLPSISLFLNMYLMAELDPHTWIRFMVWMAMGCIVYFTYSIRNSAERHRSLTTATVKAAEAEGTTIVLGIPVATYL